MSGDASGRTFRFLMEIAGIAESEVFITNAVLCNPRGSSGANRPPLASEIRNCSPFLRRAIELLNPPLVVTIGSAALKAVGRIESHGLNLAENIAEPAAWFGRTLIPLYHPSPQVLISRRSLAQQEEDWRRMASHLRGH
jgi:uracil-DNA glycosylase family 4